MTVVKEMMMMMIKMAATIKMIMMSKNYSAGSMNTNVFNSVLSCHNWSKLGVTFSL